MKSVAILAQVAQICLICPFDWLTLRSPFFSSMGKKKTAAVLTVKTASGVVTAVHERAAALEHLAALRSEPCKDVSSSEAQLAAAAQSISRDGNALVKLLGGDTLADGLRVLRCVGHCPPGHLVRDMREVDSAWRLLRHPLLSGQVFTRAQEWFESLGVETKESPAVAVQEDTTILVKKKKSKQRKKKPAGDVRMGGDIDDEWADSLRSSPLAAPLALPASAAVSNSTSSSEPTRPVIAPRALSRGPSDESSVPPPKQAKPAPAFVPQLRVGATVRILVSRGGIVERSIGEVCTEEWTNWRGWEVKAVIKEGVDRATYIQAYNAATAVKFKARELEVIS